MYIFRVATPKKYDAHASSPNGPAAVARFGICSGLSPARLILEEAGDFPVIRGQLPQGLRRDLQPPDVPPELQHTGLRPGCRNQEQGPQFEIKVLAVEGQHPGL